VIWRLSFKNVFRNQRRTVLTVAVVAVGASMLILAQGYVEFITWGLAESFIHGQTGHFQVVATESLSDDEHQLLEHGVERWLELVEDLESTEHVQVATPRISFSGLITTGESSNVALIDAVDPRRELVLGAEHVDSEPLVSLAEAEDGVVLGSGLAALLQVQVGDEVTLLTTTADGALNAIDLRIVATIEVFSEELNSRYAMIALDSAQAVLVTDKVENVIVGLDSTEYLSLAAAAARKRWSPEYAIRLWHEITPYYGKVLAFFRQLIFFLAPVLMLIVWFSAMNTVLMSVLERSAELATLRALGTSGATLVRMLVYEGIWLALLGVTAAVVLELGLSAIINHANITVPPPPGQTSGYALQIRNVASSFVTVAVMTVAVVVASTVIPALRIGRMNIVHALRKGA
jgi:putative ABC transport system permease protein